MPKNYRPNSSQKVLAIYFWKVKRKLVKIKTVKLTDFKKYIYFPFLYRFDCKSASYDHLRKECHLSADDRHNNPDSFVTKAGTDYLGKNWLPWNCRPSLRKILAYFLREYYQSIGRIFSPINNNLIFSFRKSM